MYTVRGPRRTRRPGSAPCTIWRCSVTAPIVCAAVLILALALACALAFQTPPAAVSPLADAVRPAGCSSTPMATASPISSTENRRAGAAQRRRECRRGQPGGTPRLRLHRIDAAAGGRRAEPRATVRASGSGRKRSPDGLARRKEEGGVFLAGGNLAVVGADDAGLLAAAEAYSARAPYQWRVPGEKLSAIADAVHGELHRRHLPARQAAFIAPFCAAAIPSPPRL